MIRYVLILGVGLMIGGCRSSDRKEEKKVEDTVKPEQRPIVKGEGPFEAIKMSRGDLPLRIHFAGRFVEGWRWQDKSGYNFFVMSVSLPKTDTMPALDTEETQAATVHAVHFIRASGGDYVVHTQLNDTEKDCPFDITAEFVPGSATITDLDNDGIAEVKFQYAKACRSDVSPSRMKLLMYENKKPHTLEGNRWILYSPDVKFEVTEKDVNLAKLPKIKDETESLFRSFGRYENEKEFAGAPPAFLEFARKEWIKHAKEEVSQ